MLYHFTINKRNGVTEILHLRIDLICCLFKSIGVSFYIPFTPILNGDFFAGCHELRKQFGHLTDNNRTSALRILICPVDQLRSVFRKSKRIAFIIVFYVFVFQRVFHYFSPLKIFVIMLFLSSIPAFLESRFAMYSSYSFSFAIIK